MKATSAMPAKKKQGSMLTAHVLAFYASNDESHLSPVFQALGPYLNRFSFIMLGIKCPARRSDLVQDSLIHILEQLRKRKFEAQIGESGQYNSILAWVCMVHRNLFINTTRLKQTPSRPNIAEDALRDVSTWRIAQVADAAQFDDRAAAAKTLAAVEAAVMRLPAKLQACFRLFYYESLPYEKIAEQLGIPKVTCRTRVYHALKTLKKWAAQSLLKPTEEMYAALVSTDTGTRFGKGRSYAARGFYSNPKQRQARYREARTTFPIAA